jgi:hypothetical protein
MDNNELHQWSRHYDTLLWNVTTIFAAAIGGLLVYCYSNFNDIISLVGLIITPLPIYFAASFRELRKKINQHLNEADRKILHENRELKQWLLYVFIFLLFEFLWLWLLLSKATKLWWLWLFVGCTIFICSIRWAHLGKA